MDKLLDTFSATIENGVPSLLFPLPTEDRLLTDISSFILLKEANNNFWRATPALSVRLFSIMTLINPISFALLRERKDKLNLWFISHRSLLLLKEFKNSRKTLKSCTTLQLPTISPLLWWLLKNMDFSTLLLNSDLFISTKLLLASRSSRLEFQLNQFSLWLRISLMTVFSPSTKTGLFTEE